MKTLGAIGASVAAALSAAGAVCCSAQQPVACGGCGCADANNTQTLEVPFTPCGDAAADAADDAGGDGGAACFATCAEACTASSPAAICVGTSDDAGQTVAECQVTAACTGRAFAGLAAPGEARTFGDALARMAWLEAMSVRAFERLARELRFHGAPRALVRRAEESARDEVRHARAMARLAKKHGASVPRLPRVDAGVRDLESVARENAAEGCVRETFGAAQAALGARHVDPTYARAMRAIAADELRRAALGWDVAAWADRSLSRSARARVRAERDEAARRLLQDTRTSPRDRAMAESLVGTLWAA